MPRDSPDRWGRSMPVRGEGVPLPSSTYEGKVALYGCFGIVATVSNVVSASTGFFCWAKRKTR